MNKREKALVGYIIKFNKLLSNTFIPEFQKGSLLDKKDITQLKTASTYLDKTASKIINQIDKSLATHFMKDLDTMNLVLKTNKEVVEEYTKMQKDDNYCIVRRDSFATLMWAAIQGCCNPCRIEDYSNCKFRECLRNFNLEPFDIEAKGCCEYMYSKAEIDKEYDDVLVKGAMKDE